MTFQIKSKTLALTLTAVGSVVAEFALTLPEDALPAAVAALRAVERTKKYLHVNNNITLKFKEYLAANARICLNKIGF